jgi:hypothetical protein
MPWITVATVVLLAYALVDAITTDTHLVRHLPKLLWVVVVVLVPIIGPLCWIFLGRPRGGSLLPGTTGESEYVPRRDTRRPLAPDDDPEFLRRLGDPRDDR